LSVPIINQVLGLELIAQKDHKEIHGCRSVFLRSLDLLYCLDQKVDLVSFGSFHFHFEHERISLINLLPRRGGEGEITDDCMRSVFA
jgi:hypothetical protein